MLYDIIVDFFIFIYLNIMKPKNGEHKEWYNNGQLRKHCYYKDGILDGEYKDWWDNGQMWEHYYCKNGRKNGEYKSWYEEGQLCDHYYYRNGNECTYEEYYSLGLECYIRRNMNGDVKVICDS